MLMEWCNDCLRYHGRGYCEASGSLQSVCSPASDPYHSDSPRKCPRCNWRGTRGSAHTIRGLLSCPKCQIPGDLRMPENDKLTDHRPE